MIKLVDQRNAVDVVHIDFCKAFNTVKHCIHFDKLEKCDHQTTIENMIFSGSLSTSNALTDSL